MSNSFRGKQPAPEGYVYHSWGEKKYLKHVLASITTLRRYDTRRPVALFCTENHRTILEKSSLSHLFSRIFILSEEHASITGFKHNVHKFMPFQRNLYLDGDIVWCKDPNPLWSFFSPFRFTITGNQIADNFFGGPKGLGVLWHILLRRRQRTLKRFGLTYLSRVQSGMIYAADAGQTQQVCELAGRLLGQRHLTHFRSRTEEAGRSEETCEWSLAMAMAKLNVQVVPWRLGLHSPQLDFIESYTTYDENFEHVECILYSDRFVHDLKTLNPYWLRRFLIWLLSWIPGKGDYLTVTPYCLHFGWINQKEPFNRFAERVWDKMRGET